MTQNLQIAERAGIREHFVFKRTAWNALIAVTLPEESQKRARQGKLYALMGVSFYPHSDMSQPNGWGWLTPSVGCRGRAPCVSPAGGRKGEVLKLFLYLTNGSNLTEREYGIL
ncbi:hypothetical protein ACVLD2_001241 [Paenibacillus sp. PvR052]|nr:hypothetical protein [Paenibacillus sp. PvP091]MBP1169767.1 hypothetical protein [Paenibacillus sp. PvR098]MBP2440795.1 hypothetical protein [Paenibacillus sp. PvP052]